LELISDSVNRAFSKQAIHYDTDDDANVILRNLRNQVYQHVDQFLNSSSRILELNAGTGIDALRFVSKGHSVHAIDIASGMIGQINTKISKNNLQNVLTCQQLSYTELDKIKLENFDHVFSNFGGLNCVDNLSLVTHKLENLLKPGAHVTWVIMPRICLWELLSFFKASRTAFRRLKKGGTIAQLEGEYFHTYYHSLSKIKDAFGPNFSLIKVEGLAAVSPPPHRADVPLKYPRMYQHLVNLDKALRHSFPFNRWADHLIATFRFNG
jgi:ubiquinone/menaquinone biosynthesis C-methylase UbiE